MDYLNFSTRASSRAERGRQWRMATKVAHAEFEDEREASIRGCDLGEVRICALSAGRHRAEFESPREGGAGLVKLLFQEEGRCRVTNEQGTSLTIGPGQWCVIDKDDLSSLEALEPVRQIALALPRQRIASWNTRREAFATPAGFLGGTPHVLHSTALAAIGAGVHIGRCDRARLGDALIALINVAWHEDRPFEGGQSLRARRAAVLAHIERNLADPDLDVSAIASTFGYSKRTLHKLFENQSSTLCRVIWERRLERCRRELLDPCQAQRTITAIAHEWGFSDSQHFCRSFKARFGAAPREFRNAHLPC